MTNKVSSDLMTIRELKSRSANLRKELRITIKKREGKSRDTKPYRKHQKRIIFLNRKIIWYLATANKMKRDERELGLL